METINWDAVSAVSEALGLIVVVVSLAYVALQIKQNTNAMQSASAQNLINVSTTGHFLIAADNGLAQVIQRGLYDPGSLEDYEKLRLNSALLGFYVQYDFAYRQFLKGELDATTWERMEFEMIVFLKMPGGADWWAQDKKRLSPPFVKFIEERLAKFEIPETLPTLGPNRGQAST